MLNPEGLSQITGCDVWPRRAGGSGESAEKEGRQGLGPEAKVPRLETPTRARARWGSGGRPRSRAVGPGHVTRGGGRPSISAERARLSLSARLPTGPVRGLGD